MKRVPDAKVAADCRPNQGAATCRFLVINGAGWHCAKHDRHIAAALNVRVEQGTMNARGDNCEGVP